MTDLGGECQIVDDCTNFGSHPGVVFQVKDFKLLGPHEAICDFFSGLGAEACVLQIELANLAEISEDLANGLGVV